MDGEFAGAEEVGVDFVEVASGGLEDVEEGLAVGGGGAGGDLRAEAFDLFEFSGDPESDATAVEDGIVGEADGVEVSSPDAVSTAREVVVYNRQPYARRLEPTWGSPRLSRMAPNGVMEVAEQRVRRRFGGVAAIKFSYATRSGEVVPIIKITPKSRRTQGIA